MNAHPGVGDRKARAMGVVDKKRAAAETRWQDERLRERQISALCAGRTALATVWRHCDMKGTVLRMAVRCGALGGMG